MHSCTKRLDSIAHFFVVLGLLLSANSAFAEGIVLLKTNTRAIENAYEISTEFKIVLPPSVEEALRHGVVLNFVSELSLTHSRWYWMDQRLVSTEQNTKLSYNALTQQYRISRGTLYQGFQNLDSALRILGRPSPLVLPVSELDENAGYVARWLGSEKVYSASAQMRLDIAQLPKPLQVSAFTNNEWLLDSQIYRWPVKFSTRSGEALP